MKKPQFAERQYETAANIELAGGRASPFVPTQHIEAYLGIDAAHDPTRAHAIWRILNVQIPRRVALVPGLWPALPPRFHDEVPGRYASLFMQFKRPIFQDHARAKYHGQIGGPYYEVSITRHQQTQLIKLETRVSGMALVRYASPAFWSRNDFDRHDEHRTVLVNSAYISPAAVKSHRRWMYAEASGRVLLNPEPEEKRRESWESVVAELTEIAEDQSLRQHIRALAALLEEFGQQQIAFEDSGWARRLREYGRFSSEDLALLSDLRTVSQTAEGADVTWIVLLLPNGDWRDFFNDGHQWRWGHWRWWPWW